MSDVEVFLLVWHTEKKWWIFFSDAVQLRSNPLRGMVWLCLSYEQDLLQRAKSLPE